MKYFLSLIGVILVMALLHHQPDARFVASMSGNKLGYDGDFLRKFTITQAYFTRVSAFYTHEDREKFQSMQTLMRMMDAYPQLLPKPTAQTVSGYYAVMALYAALLGYQSVDDYRNYLLLQSTIDNSLVSRYKKVPDLRDRMEQLTTDKLRADQSQQQKMNEYEFVCEAACESERETCTLDAFGKAMQIEPACTANVPNLPIQYETCRWVNTAQTGYTFIDKQGAILYYSETRTGKVPAGGGRIKGHWTKQSIKSVLRSSAEEAMVVCMHKQQLTYNQILYACWSAHHSCEAGCKSY